MICVLRWRAPLILSVLSMKFSEIVVIAAGGSIHLYLNYFNIIQLNCSFHLQKQSQLGNFEDAVLGLYHRVALLSLDNKVKRCPAVIDYQQWQLEVFKTSNTNIKSSRTVKWRHKCYITNMALAVSHFGPGFLLLINHIPNRMITNVSYSLFSYQLETLTIFKVWYLYFY